MTLTQEEIVDLKDQLRQQVQHLPQQQKEAALHQIETMSPEALEQLVEEQRQKNPRASKSIYRMLVDGEVPSVKIDENDWAVALLEINPASRGQAIVIPKTLVKDSEELPQAVMKFARILAKRMTKKLVAKNTDILVEHKFGESVISLIPIYTTPITATSPRARATQEELESIATQLKQKKKVQRVRIKKKATKSNQILKLQRRIP